MTDDEKGEEMRADYADVIAAVAEAYDETGQEIWWNNYYDSELAKRKRMVAGVLAEWSGQR